MLFGFIIEKWLGVDLTALKKSTFLQLKLHQFFSINAWWTQLYIFGLI
jgi:hypothetical protein